jgi:hypothetical protein
MRFRKLRIAWSVAWGLAAVSLIVLWVRSYWIVDFIGRGFRAPPETTIVSIFSNYGTLALTRRRVPSGQLKFAVPDGWSYATGEQKFTPQRKFFLRSTNNEVMVQFPTWLPVPFLAAAAVFPWTGIKLRFSLRTLLIATTLLAVVLGLVVWAVGK